MRAMGGADSSTRRREPAVGGWREESLRFLELLALSGVAVAQPVFDGLGKDVSGLLPLEPSRLDLVVFTAVVVLVPALAALGAGLLVGLVAPRLRQRAHALTLGVFAGSVAVQVLKKSPLPARGVLAIAAVGGLAFAVTVVLFAVIRSWLRIMAVGPAVFAALFLLAPEMSPLLGTGAVAAPADVSVGKPARVVMIVLDELPLASLLDGNGEIDAGLFPHFAGLAEDATWYRNTSSVAPATLWAVPAILTGELPSGERTSASASGHPRNLFTLLGGTYEMNVHETATRLCPPDMCESAARAGSSRRGLSGLLRTGWEFWQDVAGPERATAPEFMVPGLLEDSLREGESFVDSIDESEGPRLDFLHLLMPHQPWHYLPGGRDNGEGGDAEGLTGNKDRWRSEGSALRGRQRHLLQVQAVDWLLGGVIDRLKSLGEYDETLIAVTADHGVSFTAGEPLRGASDRNFGEIMWVPLLVKAPGQISGEVDDRPVLSVDVLPTIASHLRVAVPWRIDGQSALASQRDEDRPERRWFQNTLRPAEGSAFAHVDGTAGFERVISTPAWQPVGDVRTRLYSLGEYDDLVGRDAGSLLDAGERALRGNLESGDGPVEVPDAGARRVPWTVVGGEVRDVAEGTSIAVAVNGVVAGVSTAWRDGDGGVARFEVLLDPDRFRDGTNDVRAYGVVGDASAPRLVPIEPDGNRDG